MSCTTCTKAQPLPNCITDLTIGILAVNDTDVYVYFRKLSNRRVERLEATTGASGLLTVDVSTLSEFFHSGSSYEVWATTQDAESIFDYQAITIGADTDNCLLLTFEKVQSATYTAATIQLI